MVLVLTKVYVSKAAFQSESLIAIPTGGNAIGTVPVDSVVRSLDKWCSAM